MGEGLKVVTGAASGIGRAVAEAFGRSGASLLLVDCDAALLEAATQAIQRLGARVDSIVADLAAREGCAEVVLRALGHGQVDGLVNVAGVMLQGDAVATIGDDDLERLFAVNVFAAIRLTRGMLPALRATGHAVVVNTTSVHAFASMPGCAAYAASKGALTALTRQMAIDLAQDGIRVVAVAPGSVDTPLTRRELSRLGLTPEQAGFSTDPRALGRISAPSEVADVITWVCSEGARLVNGSTIVADAGLLARLV